MVTITKQFKTQDKWDHLNLIHIKPLSGTNHSPLLSNIDKSYIWIEEKNKRINKFSIGYIINSNLIIIKVLKEQVTKFMKAVFGTITQQHISKNNQKITQELYNYFCFMRPDKKNLGKF